jgi:hypothetical protein
MEHAPRPRVRRRFLRSAGPVAAMQSQDRLFMALTVLAMLGTIALIAVVVLPR